MRQKCWSAIIQSKVLKKIAFCSYMYIYLGPFLHTYVSMQLIDTWHQRNSRCYYYTPQSPPYTLSLSFFFPEKCNIPPPPAPESPSNALSTGSVERESKRHRCISTGICVENGWDFKWSGHKRQRSTSTMLSHTTHRIRLPVAANLKKKTFTSFKNSYIL